MLVRARAVSNRWRIPLRVGNVCGICDLRRQNYLLSHPSILHKEITKLGSSGYKVDKLSLLKKMNSARG